MVGRGFAVFALDAYSTSLEWLFLSGPPARVHRAHHVPGAAPLPDVVLLHARAARGRERDGGRRRRRAARHAVAGPAGEVRQTAAVIE